MQLHVLSIGRVGADQQNLLKREDAQMERVTRDRAVLGLADAISALRRELITAADEGKNEAMRFAIEPMELTVQVAVTKDVDGKIGWDILGVGGKYEHVTTQSLTLKLAPVWQTPDGSMTTDFTISSLAAAGDTIGRVED